MERIYDGSRRLTNPSFSSMEGITCSRNPGVIAEK